MLPYLLMLQTKTFILRLQIFPNQATRSSRKNKIELATENNRVRNKAPAGGKGLNAVNPKYPL